MRFKVSDELRDKIAKDYEADCVKHGEVLEVNLYFAGYMANFKTIKLHEQQAKDYALGQLASIRRFGVFEKLTKHTTRH